MKNDFKKDYNYDLEDIFTALNEMEPSAVLKLAGFEPKGVKWIGAGHFKCYCPFPQHGMDNHPGSFDVNDKKRIAKCFACNAGGRPISIFRELYGLEDNFVAGMMLAKLTGKIPAGDCDRILNSYLEKDGKPKEGRKRLSSKTYKAESSAPETQQENFIQPVEVRNAFYAELLKHLPLQSQDRQYLLEERALSEDSLKDFFSYSLSQDKLKQIMQQTVEALQWPIEQFYGIPGVYEVSDTKSTYLTLTARFHPCLGIVVRNFKGQIENLQFRQYEESESGQRYFWLSSEFANSKNRPLWSHGTMGTIAVGYEQGAGEGKHFIAFTEGKFKSMVLASYGYNVFSIQGVGNWRRGLQDLKEYMELHPDTPQKIYMAFDADQKLNPSVATATKNFAEALGDLGFQVQILDWDIQLGKGIDDVINHGFGKQIKSVNAQTFIRCHINPLLQKIEKEKMRRQELLQNKM